VSVLDDLRSIERRVAERLAELEPRVREYNDLRAEAERRHLALPASDGSPRSHARAVAAKAPRSSARATHRAPVAGRRRREQILKLVNKRPGITVAELGKELKVDPTSLYRAVNALSQEGRSRRSGATCIPRSGMGR